MPAGGDVGGWGGRGAIKGVRDAGCSKRMLVAMSGVASFQTIDKCVSGFESSV